MKIFSANTSIDDIVRERANDVREVYQLQTGKLPGQIRTANRAVPSSPTDVSAGDMEGDWLCDATYIYTLRSISGTLKWDRQAHSTGW